MTYKQWLDSYNKEPFDYSPNARDGWFACKNEVLKIIEEHPNLDEKTSILKAFEKIKKL